MTNDAEFDAKYRELLREQPGMAVYPHQVRYALGRAQVPPAPRPRLAAPPRPVAVHPTDALAAPVPAPSRPLTAWTTTGVERAGWLGRRWRWHATLWTDAGEDRTVSGWAWRWATACGRASAAAIEMQRGRQVLRG
jgi:hypothetical protein